MVGLSYYKPSTLLIEVPDNNIDNKLGVKGLVVENRNPLPPTTKPRVTLDHWSANNGSIIYAHPSLLKNGFNSSNSTTNTNLETRDKDSQSITMSNATGATIATTKQYNNNISALYLNGNCRLNGQSRENQKVAINGDEQLNCNNLKSNDSNNNFHHSNNQINSPNSHQQNGNRRLTTISLRSGNTFNHNISDDNLNHVNSTKWSNGTAASDLLF